MPLGMVEGTEVGFTLGLKNHEGTLKLPLMDSGCYVKEITIKLDGGTSWLYQGMINAFEEEIGSAVENAITNKLKDGILKLDSFLQSLPKEIPVDDNASLNVSFVENPLLSKSSIEFDINGSFTAREKVPVPKYCRQTWQPSVFCSDQPKMLGISLDEAVFNSASALYYDFMLIGSPLPFLCLFVFVTVHLLYYLIVKLKVSTCGQAEFMEWIVDKVPDQALLNTAGWRFIIPQLYKKYPNDEMNLNVYLSSPPVIRISEHNMGATVYAGVIIDVVEAGEIIPFACISLVSLLKFHLPISSVLIIVAGMGAIIEMAFSGIQEIHGSSSVKIVRNNLGGSVKLDDLAMSLKWGHISN
ncbi:hypothetical protein CRYUN_Cryun20dG0110700 [Craigia yunnanensis]